MGAGKTFFFRRHSKWFLDSYCSQSVVPGTAASAERGSLLQRPFSGPTLDLLEQKFWGWGPRICVLTSPPVTLAHMKMWEPPPQVHKAASTQELGEIMSYQGLACEVQAKLKQFSLLDSRSSWGQTSRRTLFRKDGSLFLFYLQSIWCLKCTSESFQNCRYKNAIFRKWNCTLTFRLDLWPAIGLLKMPTSLSAAVKYLIHSWWCIY